VRAGKGLGSIACCQFLTARTAASANDAKTVAPTTSTHIYQYEKMSAKESDRIP